MSDDRAAVAAFLQWTPGPLDRSPFRDQGGWTRHLPGPGLPSEYPAAGS